MPNFKEITCKAACNKLKAPYPYDWDLNIYRGCEHGCKYCYALYSHRYLENEEFFDSIYVKTNIVEQLEKQLKSPRWKGEVINLGSVCDSYQPAEKQYKIMPEIWKVLIKYKNPVVISTKSDLILRDYDLIAELAKHTYVNVAATIITTNEEIRKLTEPMGVPSQKRFEMLKEFSKTDASTGVHMMPILPFITDNDGELNSLFKGAKDCGADYAIVSSLNLRGPTREVYFNFIKNKFPNLYNDYMKLYKNGSAGKEYRKELQSRVWEIRKKYGMTKKYSTPMEEKLKDRVGTQLSLFS